MSQTTKFALVAPLMTACFLFSAGLTAANGTTPDRLVPREASEWCNIWISHADKNDLPRVLMIGDSISVGYFADVEKQMAGKAYVARLSTSRCVGDPVQVGRMPDYTADRHPLHRDFAGSGAWVDAQEKFPGAGPIWHQRPRPAEHADCNLAFARFLRHWSPLPL